MKRHICIFTGTRADYGLLRPLMSELKGDSQIRLSIVASGMHLSSEFGLTCNEIISDGFDIDEPVEMLMSSDTPIGICKSMGIGMMGLSEAFQRLKPDISVVLGDRFEAFAAASSLMMLNIPLAHIHGGESSFGAIDDAIRHCITKMGHLHFTATEAYRQRVIQMGELPESVFNVGALGVENTRKTALVTPEVFKEKTGFGLTENTFLVTFHPATRDRGQTLGQLNELFSALDRFPDANIIFTKANADEDGRKINQVLEDYTSKKGGTVLFDSLGTQLYLSAVKYSAMVLGNSSSGIIEAPALGTPTVNIGSRQDGRIKPESVIDCEPFEKSIAQAIIKAGSSRFKKQMTNMKNPYEKADTALAIKTILKQVDLEKIGYKKFYDIPGQNR